MNDDIVKRLRAIDHLSVEDCFVQSFLYEKAADRIEALEAALAKAELALLEIDALDPEGKIDGCSQSALRGLVLRMGEIARDARESIK